MNSALSHLYYPSSEITQVSVSDSDIQWTNDVVKSGDDKVYTPEYPNPVDLNTVFSNVGGGLQTFSCFYRMSPVYLLGSVQLALRGNVRKTYFLIDTFLNIRCGGVQMYYVLMVYIFLTCRTK